MTDTCMENNPTSVSVPYVNKPFYQMVKRIADIVIALLSGILLAVPMVIVAAIIRLESPGPAIFKQARLGKDGKPFMIMKFRTMRTDAPGQMAAREFRNSGEYITRFGAFLRRTSIDELPQLMNILRGEMSFVGYRPVCLTETELNRLRMEYGVFSVRPGLTGLAQVRGRDGLDYHEKAEIDAEYVRDCGFAMDLWCLLKTVAVVFTGEGVL